MSLHIVNTGTDARVVLSKLIINESTVIDTLSEADIDLNMLLEKPRIINQYIYKLADKVKSKNIDSYFRALVDAHRRNRGISIYKHRVTADNITLRWSDKVIGNRLLYLFANSSMQYYNKLNKIDNTLYGILNKQNSILMAGYTNRYNQYIGICSKQLNLPLKLFINSNKDVHIDPYIPFVPLKVTVWNNTMKEIYCYFNPQIKKERFCVLGNPRLEEFRNYKAEKPVSYYQQKFNIPFKAITILYTCVNPKIVPDEFDTVKLVIDTLKSDLIKSDWSFIIRTNPMDEKPERWLKLAEPGKIGINIPEWIWDPVSAFNLANYESESEWKDLLFHSTLTMNIASTVTFESLLMHKPVINIMFGTQSSKDKVYFFNSAPYRIFHNNIAVKPLFTLSELNKTIKSLIKLKDIELSKDILVPFDKEFVNEEV